MRLIDADALCEHWHISEKCEECHWNNRDCSKPPYYSLRDICEAIDEVPTIDAIPVVHGRWVSKSEEGIYGPTYCSICDFELRIDDMPYCPMCGAKMDEEART